MTEQPLTPQDVAKQFKKLTEQIKQLEGMIEENKKLAQQCHSRNSHLRETIKQLKEKRSEVVFAERHYHPY